MASNSFLIPGTTTTVTFVSDAPIEGVGPYGPYRAYTVQTDDGVQRTFYPPKYLADALQQIGICRGLAVKLRASEARTRDGRQYTRIEIAGTDDTGSHPVAESVPRPQPEARRDFGDNGNRILASVALKAATATRGIAGEPQEIIETAITYLAWLKSA